MVDLRSDPAEPAGAILDLRIFRGYAGWAATQLEGELSAGGWFVTEPGLTDAFTRAPDALWHRAIRRRPHGPQLDRHAPQAAAAELTPPNRPCPAAPHAPRSVAEVMSSRLAS